MKNFTFLFVLLISIAIFPPKIIGQNIDGNSFLEKAIAPPTTEVKSMLKHIVVPEVENNGIVPIEIPLYTIDEGEINIPLVLRYHPSGIGVGQLAGWTGLGWNLSPAGMISRLVNGLPDDYINLRDFKQYTSPLHSSLGYFGWLSEYSPRKALASTSFPNVSGDCFWNSTSFDHDNSKNQVNEIIRKIKGEWIHPVWNPYGPNGPWCWEHPDVLGPFRFEHDSEPDEFFISAPGMVERFAFDSNAIPRVLHSNNQLQFEMTWEADSSQGFYRYPENEFIIPEWATRISGFQVTNTEGVRYVFNNKVKSTTYKKYNLYELMEGTQLHVHSIRPELVDTFQHVSAWYISEIHYPNGQYAHFDYDRVTIEREEMLVEYDKESFTEIYLKKMFPDWPTIPLILKDGGVVKSKIIDETLYLKSITTQNTKVEFNCLTERYDELKLESDVGANLLTNIEIFSIHSEQPNLVKKIEFNYHLITSTQPSGVEIEKCRRHFLSNIILRGSDDEMQKYSFNYNATKLPHRFSAEQDHWGYYNSNGSTSLIPRIYVYLESQNEDRFRNYPCNSCGSVILMQGADRSVNESTIKAGVLERITLPTGGIIKYHHEPNDYYDEKYGGNIKAGGLRISKVQYINNDGVSIVRERIFNFNLENGNSSGVLINKPVYAVQKGYAKKQPELYEWAPNLYTPMPDYYDMYYYNSGIVSEWNHTTASFVDLGWSLQQKVDTFTQRTSFSQSASNFLNSRTLSYTRVKIIDKNNLSDNGYVIRNYYPPKNFKNLLNASHVETTTSQAYNQFRIDQNGSDAQKCHDCYEYDAVGIHNNGEWHIQCGCWDGHMVWGDIQKSGRNIMPYPPLSDANSLIDGQLILEEVFSQSGNRLKRTTYSHETVGAAIDIYGLRYQQHLTSCLRYPLPHLSKVAPYAWSRYRIKANANLKVSQITTEEFDLNGQNPIVSTEHFNYDYRGFLTEHTKWDSHGDEFTTKTTYPHSYGPFHASIGTSPRDNATNAIYTMINRNMLNYPIEKYTIKDNLIINGDLLLYSYNSATGRILPSEQLKLDLTNPIDASNFQSSIEWVNQTFTFLKSEMYYPILHFNKYDHHGNILQYYKTNNINTSFLWGYNNVLPIAKVENAVYNQIAYTSFETYDNNNEFYNNWEIVDGPWIYYENGYFSKGSMGTESSRAPIDTKSNLPVGKYILSFYSSRANVSSSICYIDVKVNGAQISRLLCETGWSKSSLELNLTQPGMVQLELSNTKIDHLLIHPSNALVTTYTHEPLIGVSSITDEQGFATYFEYNGLGLLKRILDHQRNVIQELDYHYKNP